jgi:hypothetical protein
MATLTITVTTVYKNMLRDALKGDVTDCQIKYVAWGDGTTAPAASDTKLVNELGRHLVTNRTSGATGILDTIIYLAPADAVADIKEIGFFAGAAASGTKDSGVLVGRGLYSKNKTNLESIQIDLKTTEA